jgi:superfamily II DNA or RNA helicase
MTTLTVGTLRTTIDGPPAAVRAVADTLTVPGVNYWFSPAYKAGRWDGKYRFYSAKLNAFPTGLLPVVMKRLHDLNESVAFLDRRPSDFTITLPLIERFHDDRRLRDYQEAAIQAVFTNTLSDTHGTTIAFPRGVIQMATGAGKTLTIAGLLRLVTTPSLVLVHRKELLHQTQAVLHAALGVPVGCVGDSLYDPQPITVAMVPTIAANLDAPATREWLATIGTLITDEAHHLAAATFSKVAAACPNAYCRVAISATPFKRNNLPQQFQVQAQTGALLYEHQAARLIDAGYLAPVTVEYTAIHGPKLARGIPYRLLYDEGIVRHPARNNDIVAKAHESIRHGRHVLILVTRREHGTLLAGRIGCQFLSGKDPSSVRQQVKQSFTTGQTTALVVSTIWDEGVDAPDIDHIILAGGGKSDLQLLQRIGRGMRKKSDGRSLLVSDYLDLHATILTRHSVDRFLAVRTAGFSLHPLAHDTPAFFREAATA